MNLRASMLLPVLLTWGCTTTTRHSDGGVPHRDASWERPDAGAQDAGLDAGPPTPSLAVATYNVHRFFDTVCDTGACDAGAYEEQPTDNTFQARADVIAAAIQWLDADVVMLEEVETQACLDALSARLGTAYPTARLGEINTPASVDVAVVSKLPFLEARTHRQVPLVRRDGGEVLFSRELLEVHLQGNGRRVIAFAAHFRSMVNDDPERRLLEAQATRVIMEASAREFPDALVVMGGDLNAVPGSVTLDALELDGGLFRADSDLAPDASATWGGTSALDHVYVTPNGQPSYLPGSAQVVRSPGKTGMGDSDHAAMRARFVTPD